MALQMVFIEPTPPSSEMVVAASSSSLVSEQNALAQTLMNLSGNNPSSSASSASSSSSSSSSSAPRDDAVPSSSGADQFRVQYPHHPLPLPPAGAPPLGASSSPSPGFPQSSPSPYLFQPAAAGSSPSPLKDSSPYPASPGKQLFYKNKRKAYPVRSPHMEHRQSPPGIVFQFPSVFIKEGSEHLSPKLNVIFYPEAAPASPKSPLLHQQRPSPVSAASSSSTATAAAAAAAVSRARASVRNKTTNTRLQSLSGPPHSEGPKSKRRLKEVRYDENLDSSEDDRPQSQQPLRDDEDDEDEQEQDLRGAEQLASLLRGDVARPKPKKRKAVTQGGAADEEGPSKKPKKPRGPRKDKVPVIQVTVQNPDGSFTTTEVPGERPRRAKMAAHDALEGRGNNSEEGDLSDNSGDGDTETGGKDPAGGSEKPKAAAVASKPGASKKVCASCGTSNTPYWRDGWHTCTLCNACGIRYQKYKMRCLNCIYIPRKEETSNPRCSRCGHTMSR